MKKFLVVVGFLLLPLWAYLLYGAMLWLLGYELTSSPTKLAQKLVEEGRPVKDCLLLRTLDLGPRPTTPELRGTCIYTYASLTLDPSACELLLPSEYGLACLSEVGGRLFQDIQCHEKAGKGGLYCRGETGAELVVESPQIRDCSVYGRADVREWCHYMRTYKLAGVYECNHIRRPEAREDCERGFAFKQKDPSLCTAVQDKKRRQYCEIRINAWLKYPELRGSFYFGTPVPVDAPQEPLTP